MADRRGSELDPKSNIQRIDEVFINDSQATPLSDDANKRVKIKDLHKRAIQYESDTYTVGAEDGQKLILMTVDVTSKTLNLETTSLQINDYIEVVNFSNSFALNVVAGAGVGFAEIQGTVVKPYESVYITKISANIFNLQIKGRVNEDSVDVDNSVRPLYDGASTLSETLTEIHDLILYARETGTVYGLDANVTGGVGNSATVDFTSGQVQILNNTSASNPTYLKPMITAKSALTLNSLDPLTYWYIDANDNTIKQTTTEPTVADYRTKVWLVRTSYNSTSGTITGIANIRNYVQQGSAQLRDLARLFTIRTQGIQLGNAGANQKFQITAGAIYKYGISENHLTPSDLSFSAFNTNTGSFYREVLRTGTGSTDLTDITTTQYYNGSTLTTATNNRFIKRYIWWFPSSDSQNIRVGYGSNEYTSLTDAKNSISKSDALNNVPSSYSNAYLIGVLVVQKSTTDLSNIVNAEFVNTNEFGAFGGGTGTATGSYLQIANNLSDLSNVTTARTNLGVYSTNTTDGLLQDRFSGVPNLFTLSGSIYTNTFLFFGNVKPLIFPFTVNVTNPSSFTVSITYIGVGLTNQQFKDHFGRDIPAGGLVAGRTYIARFNSATSVYEVVGLGVAKRVVSEVVTNGLTLSGNKENYELTYNSATAGTITFVATNLPNIDDRCMTRCDGVGRLTIVAPAGYTISDPDSLNGNVRNMIIIRSGATTLRIK